jgi:hypothetical protein
MGREPFSRERMEQRAAGEPHRQGTVRWMAEKWEGAAPINIAA